MCGFTRYCAIIGTIRAVILAGELQVTDSGIDQAFVRHLAVGSKDLALCEAIVVMAHKLGLQVIAEGVETALQRDLLIAAGCDFAQGYFFARPLPVDAFEALLAQQALHAALVDSANLAA